jgi:hypothetical protein
MKDEGNSRAQAGIKEGSHIGDTFKIQYAWHSPRTSEEGRENCGANYETRFRINQNLMNLTHYILSFKI